MVNEKRLIEETTITEKQFFAETQYGSGWVVAIEDIADAPTVDAVEVVHGRWEHSESMVLSAKCSKCKGWVVKHSVNELDFNYCPYCGAKMDLEEA